MSLERVDHCPLCSGTAFNHFITCKDYTQSGELFHVEQCASCQVLLTNPRPQESIAARYYKSSNYISHTSDSKGLMDRIYLIIRYFTLKWKFGMVKRYIKSNALLDIGCGTGDFLLHCKRKGVSVYGVEPAEAPRRRVLAHQIQVEQFLDRLPDIQFDVITLWHVLEHLYKLEDNINTVVKKLTKGGTVFIAVPNHESPDAEHYKSLWAAYDVPRHLWHFSKANMTHLLEKSGLKLIKIIPMRLDAYYVSMLSEKNKSNGKLGIMTLLRAVSVAFRSNARAKKDLNYSSLIYVAQK